MNVLLTAVIAVTGIVGTILVIQGGNDTARIRDAAEKQACSARQIAAASERNAIAAENFAASAASINQGVSDAARGLQIQAGKMDAARTASVQQSQQSLQATIDNFHLEQRAWIGISDVQTEGGKIDGQNFTFDRVSFVIRNTGRTPAIHLSIHCCQVITQVFDDRTIPDYDTEFAKNRKRLEEQIPPSQDREKFIEKIMNLQDTGGRGHLSEQSLAPDSFRRIPVEGHLLYENVEGALEPAPQDRSPQAMDAWVERRRPKNIFMFGKIVYSDVFTGTPIHTTTICFVREGITPRGPMAMYGGGLTFEECPQGRMD